MRRSNPQLSALLFIVLVPSGYAQERVIEQCLAIENAFARNGVNELEAMQIDQGDLAVWEALRHFRLAAAYIPEDQNRNAGHSIREGLKVVQEGLAVNPEDVELLLLGAMLDGQYLLLRPWRYFWNGRRGLRRLAKAEAIDPKNPRIALVRGTAKFILPRILGGSPREAESIFEHALSRERFPQTPFSESGLCRSGEWGQVDLLNWLARAQSKLGKTELARQTFERAARRSPKNHWVDLAIKGEGYEWTQD